MMSNPIICVDFDGVIHSYSSGWKGVDVIPDDPVPGAIEWLMKHLPVPEGLGHMGSYKGPEVCIYSSRSKERAGVKAMKEWLVKHGLPWQYIGDDILKFPTQKPPAFLTIDDRAICFNGMFPTADEMMQFKPWNKRDYPNGQLTPEDEGALQIAVGQKNGCVAIDLTKQTTWFAMPPDQAIQFAAVITNHAKELLGQTEH
jgi:hypothetical protein